jgi:hypothetical protein
MKMKKKKKEETEKKSKVTTKERRKRGILSKAQLLFLISDSPLSSTLIITIR